MATGRVSEVDVRQIHRWCARHSPTEVADQVRVVAYVDGRKVTIAEERPPYGGAADDPWESYPVAQLTYVKSRDAWNLHVAGYDAPRRYDPLPTGPLISLLQEIDADPTFIFWG